MLVYVAHASTISALSKILNSYKYHSKRLEEERASTQKEFSNYAEGIMITTTAFNVGVDIGDINLILRFSEPDYAIIYS
jgi:superfamily II DNA helicase RecQ